MQITLQSELSDFPWRRMHVVPIGGAGHGTIGTNWTGSAFAITSYNEPIAFVKSAADAQAIAALPQLIEALVEIAESLGECGSGGTVDNPCCDVMIARAALHRAGLLVTNV